MLALRKVLTSVSLFILTFFVFSATPVMAKVITDQKGSVVIAKNEVIDDDLFVAAQTVEINGVVNGDVYAGAQTVRVTGTIKGSLHVGANMFDLTGGVEGNVYVGAQSVLVSGADIGGSLLVGAATVNVDKASFVGGSVLVGSGTLNLDSQVRRSVYAGAGTLTIGDSAKIGKDLYYASGNNQGEVSISKKAKIAGNTYKSEVDTQQASKQAEAAKTKIPGIMNTVRITTTVISLIGALLVGILYHKLFGKHFAQTEAFISRSFWKSLGVGFLTMIAFVPGFIILLITVIGIPVAFLSLLIFVMFIYLAKIVVGMALGNWISQKFNWKMPVWGALALGLLVIFALKFIPVVGFLTGLVVVWTGLGSLVLGVFSKSE